MKKKILFIVDAQNDFCHKDGTLPCEGHEEAVNNIVKLLDNNKFDEVVCTADTHDDDYKRTTEGKHLPVEHCMEGTWGNFLNKKVYDALYQQHWIVLGKTGFMVKPGSLKNIFNDDYWYDVYICGFATDICVINNALLLKQFFPYSEVSLIKNCCAGTSVEMHNKAIDIMAINHINILGEYHNNDNKEDNND